MINLTKVRKYFSYGSNLSKEQMLMRCPQSNIQGNTVLPDYEFFINEKGVASIRRKRGKQVWGTIYTLTRSDENSLDKYEGYPKSYTKKDLSELNAFCYIATNKEEGLPRNGYMEKIIEAAQTHNLPEKYIAELRRWLK